MGVISVLFELKLRRIMPLPHICRTHTRSFPPEAHKPSKKASSLAARADGVVTLRSCCCPLGCGVCMRQVQGGISISLRLCAADARRNQHLQCARADISFKALGHATCMRNAAASSPLILIPSIHQSPRWDFVGHASAQNSRHDVVRTSA